MSHVMTSQHLYFFLIGFGMPVEIAAYLPISLFSLSLSLSHTHTHRHTHTDLIYSLVFLLS